MQKSACRLTFSLGKALNQAIRHTRISGFNKSAVAASQRDSVSKTSESDVAVSYPVNPSFVNRNPRCLERLSIARKTIGWEFQAPVRSYWYKVTFEKTSNHIRAAIVHHRDGEVVSASTREYAIRKHLYSGTDVSAAEAIARVLARRSLQFGITRVFYDKIETPVEPAEFSKRLEAQGIQVVRSATQTFHDTLVESGLFIGEAAVRDPPEQIGIDYDSLSEAEKRRLRPSLAYQLRTKVDKCKQSRYPYKMRPLPAEELAKPHRQRLLFDNTTGVVKRRDLVI